MIYLDNAATSWPKPDAVGAAVLAALAAGGNAGCGAYSAALDAGRALFETRRLAGRLVHAAPDRVALTSSATEGLNVVIAGLLGRGDHAVTTDLEHNSVLRPLYAARARGAALTIVASRRGLVDPDAVAAALRPGTRLAVVTHASNVLGTVQPIEAIGAACAARGVPLLVDAAQTAGVLPLRLDAPGVGAIACGGHKGLLGPQGTGLLALAEGVAPRPLLLGGTGVDSLAETMPAEPPEAYEAGTRNAPGLAGLAASLRVVLAAGAAERPSDLGAAALARARRLRAGLAELGCFEAPDVDEAAWGVPVVAGVLRSGGRVLDSQAVADALAQRGVAVRGGYHCAPLVHRACGTLASGMVRFSPGHATTDAEIDDAMAAVAAVAAAA